jgi:AcrR family transcriptional regulator
MVANAPGVAPDERRVDARRNYEHILDVASRVLGANPAASLQDIAQEVGLHRATLHRHFRTREDLMEAMRRRVSLRFLAMLDDIDATAKSPEDAVRQFVRRALEDATPEAMWRFGTYYGPGTDEYRAELNLRFSALMEGGQKAGLLRQDFTPEQLAAIWAGVGYAMLPMMHEGDIDLDGAVDTVLRTLGAPRA